MPPDALSKKITNMVSRVAKTFNIFIVGGDGDGEYFLQGGTCCLELWLDRLRRRARKLFFMISSIDDGNEVTVYTEKDGEEQVTRITGKELWKLSEEGGAFGRTRRSVSAVVRTKC